MGRSGGSLLGQFLVVGEVGRFMLYTAWLLALRGVRFRATLLCTPTVLGPMIARASALGGHLVGVIGHYIRLGGHHASYFVRSQMVLCFVVL